MKKLLVILALVTSATAQAKEQPLHYMNELLDLDRAVFTGEHVEDTTCEIKTMWVKGGDLLVQATTQYSDSAPYKMTVRFKADRALVSTEGELGSDVVFRVEQNKVLRKDGDYQVDRFESIEFIADGGGLMHVHLNVVDVDYESDPSEDGIHCEYVTESWEK